MSLAPRRIILKGVAWAAPVVVATSVVPVYAASSLVCPTAYMPVNPSVDQEVSTDSADGYYVVLFPYSFTSASQYNTLTFVTSDTVEVFESYDTQNYTIGSDGRTVTVINDSSLSELSFDIYVKVPVAKINKENSSGEYRTSVLFTIDGQCSTSDDFSDFSNSEIIRN
ncbi:hypothetical protein E4U03_11615 [Rothia nasimurium]|uniref:Uncharacterized protein n=1 Tax=Rothia nasimurium TaxID=85336 RepID=A0A4Y9F0F9_9MICC|nr:hypothetical protein [Rothia nasimurium]MBF0809248.1 hypothetical protein [Rothia nasimurium]TFU20328.1 hypothetical protein E4U03_11615 [Rothia nasimurium]